MSFDLMNAAGEEMCFNNSGWRYLMEFAEAHGFGWPTSPDGEELEELSDAQARELAEIIDRALGTGGADEVAPRVSEELTRLLVTPSQSSMFPQEPIIIRGKTIDYWREFVEYARRGGFSLNF